MKYSATSELAKAVCEHIGFNFDIHPIQVLQSKKHLGRIIYVKGTALKPDEEILLYTRVRDRPWIKIEGMGGHYCLRNPPRSGRINYRTGKPIYGKEGDRIPNLEKLFQRTQ
jgi:hypothetical protein